MGELRYPDPVLLVVAVFCGRSELFDWVQARLVDRFGGLALKSPRFEFNQTEYYAREMGQALQKEFFVFHDLVPATCLPDAKQFSNGLEGEIAAARRFPEPRPVNIDPGILSLGKFQLATTKDQAHRIYLEQGIFAEVTLRFQDGRFEPWPWTYADFRQDSVRAFLKEARDYYRRRLKEDQKLSEASVKKMGDEGIG